MPVVAHAASIFLLTIAYDKGKPSARGGRKAVSLRDLYSYAEMVWLPKVIGNESLESKPLRSWFCRPFFPRKCLLIR
jgi:hypothetical protein